MTSLSASSQRSGLAAAVERLPFLPALLILVVLVALNGWFEPNSLGFRAVTPVFAKASIVIVTYMHVLTTIATARPRTLTAQAPRADPVSS